LFDVAAWDKNARMTLSNHAYQKLWLPSIHQTNYLQKIVSGNGDVTGAQYGPQVWSLLCNVIQLLL